MLKFCRDNKGYISIFLCIVLLPMITYATMIIDASRLQSARVEVQSAGDLAMNAAMSEYNKVLEDMYGLFANAKSKDDIEPAIRNYFEETINGAIKASDSDEGKYVKQFADELASYAMKGEKFKEDELTNFLQLKLLDGEDSDTSFSFNPVPESAITNTNIMKGQIIEYMKYKGPVSVGNNLLHKIGFLQDMENQSNAVQEKIELTKKIADLGPSMDSAYDAIQTYNENAEKYNKYDEKAVVNVMQNMATHLNLMSECYVAYHYIDKLAKKYNMDKISYDNLSYNRSDYGLASSETLNNLKNATSETLAGTKSNLDTALDYVKKVVAIGDNLSGHPTYNATFEDKYGKIDYKVEDNWKVSYLLFNNKGATSNFTPTYGNLENWVNKLYELETSYLLRYSENDISYRTAFEWHLKLMSHAKDFAEYKAYKEYFKEAASAYVEQYGKYRDAFKASITDPEVDKDQAFQDDATCSRYAQICNLVIDIDGQWENSNTYKKFTNLLSYLNSDHYYKYFAIAEEHRLKADDEFVEYYNIVKLLEESSKTAVEKIAEMCTGVDGVTKDAEELTKSINTNVKDDTAKTQLKSDVEVLKNSVNQKDANNLKTLMDTYHTHAKEMKDVLEKIRYLGTDRDYMYKPYGEWGNVEYLYRSEFQIDLDESNVKDINDLYWNKFHPTITSVDLNTHLIIGHSYNELQDPFKERLKTITGLPDNETFYNVLKNSKEPKANVTDEDNKEMSAIEQTGKVDGGAPKPSGDSAATVPEKPDAAPPAVADGAFGGQSEFATAIKEISAAQTDGYKNVEGVSVGKDKDSDHKGNADKGKNQLAEANNLFKEIAKIGEHFKDTVYLEEYFTELFTCQTDKKLEAGKLKFINGYTNNPKDEKFLNPKNEWYGKEIEYILWGKNDLKANLTTTEATIFLIRFAINAIYAFTASDIQTMASTLAEALVGWTVVLVPVVQVCIVLAVALAESALDLQMLKNGDDVPLIKDKSTFICSPSGFVSGVADKVIDTAVGEATKYVTDKVDAAIDKLSEAADKKIGDAASEIKAALNGYVEQQTESLTSAISANFTTPLVSQITPIVTRINSEATNAEKVVGDAVDEVVTIIEANLNGMQDGLIKTYSKQIFNNYFKTEIGNFKKDLLSYIKPAGETKPDDIKKFIDNKIKGWVSSITSTVQKDVEKLVLGPTDDNSSIYEKLMSDEGMKGKAVSSVKSYLHDELGMLGQELSGSVKDSVKSAASQVVDKTISTKSTSVAAKITMNYKEYCKVFVFIGLIAKKDNADSMLKRAAVLMQLNVNYAVKGGDSIEPAGEKNFKMGNAYTLFSVDAEMKMGTLFPWGVKVKDDGMDADISLDLSHLGENFVNVRYSGITGY